MKIIELLIVIFVYYEFLSRAQMIRAQVVRAHLTVRKCRRAQVSVRKCRRAQVSVRKCPCASVVVRKCRVPISNNIRVTNLSARISEC